MTARVYRTARAIEAVVGGRSGRSVPRANAFSRLSRARFWSGLLPPLGTLPARISPAACARVALSGPPPALSCLPDLPREHDPRPQDVPTIEASSFSVTEEGVNSPATPLVRHRPPDPGEHAPAPPPIDQLIRTPHTPPPARPPERRAAARARTRPPAPPAPPLRTARPAHPLPVLFLTPSRCPHLSLP